MHLQVLSSGSGGNSALIRAGETGLLVDAGLPRDAMAARLESARVGLHGIDHVLVTHGHLDHSRSAGIVARAHHATVHCSASLMRQRSIARSKRLSTLTLDQVNEVDDLLVTPVRIPHDAEPTVAYRIEQAGRTAVVLTDMGRPDPAAAARLAGAHVLVLEFNHDPGMVASGPYTAALQRRILGGGGHLSNEQGAHMLRLLASDHLHTLVLAHLSQVNNRPLLALAQARATLEDLGLAHVRVEVASQDAVGPNLTV
jgi:phosphoribosyl 1,2-cyclic phosphodiesterase